MTIGSLAPATEAQQYPAQADYSLINSEKFDILDISLPPMEISTVDDWQTSSDVGTFEYVKFMNYAKFILTPALPQLSHRHVDRNKN